MEPVPCHGNARLRDQFLLAAKNFRKRATQRHYNPNLAIIGAG
jgi:hypothetical protein